MNILQDCTALVTGASSGIGREIARQLAPMARRLILVARRESLEDLAMELRAAHPSLDVQTRRVDLSDRGDTEEFANWLVGSGFDVDLLVNNAGLGDSGDFATADWYKLEEVLEVNVVALTRLTHLIAPRMWRRRHGAILNISSIASLVPVPQMAVYAATKAYVTHLGEALRVELRSSRVSVTTVCPGPVHTEFLDVATREGENPEFKSPPGLTVAVEQVAREALSAVVHREARRIPGLMPWLLMSAVALLPVFAVRAFLEIGYSNRSR